MAYCMEALGDFYWLENLFDYFFINSDLNVVIPCTFQVLMAMLQLMYSSLISSFILLPLL